MAVANLQLALLDLTQRKSDLTSHIAHIQDQISLATASQSDITTLMGCEKKSIRDYYKQLYENDPELQERYDDYTKITDYEDAIDKIAALYQDQLDEVAAWEETLKAQITEDSTELAETNAWIESYTNFLRNNIQEDFKFSLD